MIKAVRLLEFKNYFDKHDKKINPNTKVKSIFNQMQNNLKICKLNIYFLC